MTTMTPERMVKVHKAAAVLWALLAIGTTGWALVDNENKALLAWVIFMSGYANVASHLAGAAGAGPSAGETPTTGPTVDGRPAPGDDA
jgi:hypothetical protein